MQHPTPHEALLTKKSATYLELETILTEPGCPICRLGKKVGHSTLANFLWESVNDPDLRGELDKSRGFCDEHHRETLTFQGERLAAAIVQWAVMKEALRRLQASKAPLSKSLMGRLRGDRNQKEAAPALKPAGPCPVCALVAESERRSLQTLLKHLVPDFEVGLQMAGGLCWSHLGQALQMSGDEATFAALVQVHGEIWAQLVTDLGEFIRKRDYRFQHEALTEAETISIRRAIDVLTGEPPLG